MLLNSFTCFTNRENESKTLSVGDYIVFGKYYEEPILWRVIDLEEDKIMLLSDKILCIKVFDARTKESEGGTEGICSGMGKPRRLK